MRIMDSDGGEYVSTYSTGMSFVSTDYDPLGFESPRQKYEAPKRIDKALRCRYCNTAYKIPEEGVIRCPGCGAPPSEEEI